MKQPKRKQQPQQPEQPQTPPEPDQAKGLLLRGAPLLPLEAVHWLDSSGAPGWVDPIEIDPESWGTLEILSVGFILREDAKSLTVVSTLDDQVAPRQLHAPLTIPKVAILRREVLGKYTAGTGGTIRLASG